MGPLLIAYDSRCADYGSAARPEQPARVLRTSAHLKYSHPDWLWLEEFAPAPAETLPLAHTRPLLARLEIAQDIDADTPYFPNISDHARRAVQAAIRVADHACARQGPAFSLMRPPGHHATSSQSMGFCYLNSIAIAALFAQKNLGAKRVAVWDFDAHHGNGTEEILLGRPDLFFASVHQSPGYPGTGLRDRSPHVRNWPIAPYTPREDHVTALRASLDAVLDFAPDLLLVSAGFDAYVGDPITEMTLEKSDFATLGTWLAQIKIPTAAILEGGYSPDLPELVDAFLSAWTESSTQ